MFRWASKSTSTGTASDIQTICMMLSPSRWVGGEWQMGWGGGQFRTLLKGWRTELHTCVTLQARISGQ
jgi:hypothetical protein